MILLTAITPAGARLAIKTAFGIVILERVPGEKAPTALTLEEALVAPEGLERVLEFVRDNLSDPALVGILSWKQQFESVGYSNLEMSFVLG